MKHAKIQSRALSILLIAATFQSFALHGDDSTYFYTTFENDWSFIEFDPPENNIWQVGTPSKTILNSAYSAPYALMTDTTRLITEPIKHSFILKGQRPWYANAIKMWLCYADQKYHFDSLISGGYIEVSYNKGQSWTNIIFDVAYQGVYFTHYYVGNDSDSIYILPYSNSDTLENGKPSITGISRSIFDEAINISVTFPCTYASAALVYSVWLKFTYINLGSNNPHEGWMIDNLVFEIDDWCEFWWSVNDNPKNDLIKIYPNPASFEIFIAADSPLTGESQLALFDINGKLVMEQMDVAFETPINITHLPNGIYFYKIQNQQKFYTGKMMIEK